MTRHSGFLYIIDRYLEVSNVYHQRMSRGLMVETERSNLSDRVDRLLALVEGADPKRPTTPLKEISPGLAIGRTVAPTPEFLRDTKRAQEEVLSRLDSKGIGPIPRNLKALIDVLRLEPIKFLGSFPTPSYAWDILTQLASISMCPDARTLAARDMIHMHCLELQLHLVKVIAQARLSSPNDEVSLSGSFAVEQLRQLANEGTLVDRLIEFAVPRDPAKLLAELMMLLDTSPDSARNWLDTQQQEVLSHLLQEMRAFPDFLEEGDALVGATALCDALVVYGLVAAYAVWYPFARDNRDERGAFRTSILFCTRILLDESRWTVCRDFASVALATVRALNKACAEGNEHQGTGMITANAFFARRMCGESGDNLRSEILDWDTQNLHKRYQFLQKILLDDFGSAARLAEELLRVNAQTGRPDLCVSELMEWPILGEFRKSDQGKKVIATAGASRTVA